MSKEKYINWLDNLKNYWIKKDIKNILELFDKEVIYYETPFEKINNIEEVWNDIKEHELISLEYKMLGYKDNTVIVNFIMNDNNRIVDMVYEIKLNNKNKCTEFKQWWMIKEN